MGGKQKQAQRTKNNARPSNSGRSAELLGNSSGKLFSALKDNTKYIAPNNPDFDGNIHQGFQLAMKKMNKKDPITRQKALLEFANLCQTSDAESVKTVLPCWPRLYNILAVDFDYRVREAAQQAHKAIVTSIKRDIAPHLKQIMGVWFTSCFDSHLSAANIAKTNFQNAFTPLKRTEAIIFAQKEILEYIAQNIIYETSEKLFGAKNLQPEESLLKYQRIVASNLLGYSKYIEELPMDQLSEAKELHKQLILNETKFWKYSDDENKLVKASWFTVLVTLFDKTPSFLEDNYKKVCTAIFGNLDDNDTNVLSLAWKAALQSFDVIPNWWDFVNIEKMVFPKLWHVLKERAFGNAVIVGPSVLPLISKMQTSGIIKHEDFYSKLLSNIIHGLTTTKNYRTSSETEAVVSTFFECIQYAIKINLGKKDFCFFLINDHLLLLIKNSIHDNYASSSSIFFHLSLLLRQWCKMRSTFEIYGEYVDHLWKSLHSIINNSILMNKNITNEENQSVTYYKVDLDKKLQINKKLVDMLKDPCNSRQKKLTGVKFSKSLEQEETNISSTSLEYEDNPYFNNKFHEIVKDLILLYYNESKCSDYSYLFINQLCNVLNLFNEKHFYQHLAKILTEKISNSTESNDSCHIINSVIRKWLSDNGVSVDSVMNVVFHLLIYLQDEEKITILNNISEDYMISVLELCLNLANDNQMQSSVKKWLSSGYFKSTLNSFAQEVSKTWPPSLEKVNVLKTCFKAPKYGGGYTNDEIKLEILKVFRDALLHKVPKSNCHFQEPHRENLLCIAEVLKEIFREYNYPFLKRNYVVITGIIVHLFVYNRDIDTEVQNEDVINDMCLLGVKILGKILGCFSTEFMNVTRQFAYAVVALLEQNKRSLGDTKYLTNFIRIYMECLPIPVNTVKTSNDEKKETKSSQDDETPDEYSNSYVEITSAICELFIVTAIQFCHNNIEFSVVQPCLKAEFFCGTLAFQFLTLYVEPSVDYKEIDDVYGCFLPVVKAFNVADYLVTVISDYLSLVSNSEKREEICEQINKNHELKDKDLNIPCLFQYELEKFNEGIIYTVYLSSVLQSFHKNFKHASYGGLTKADLLKLDSKIRKMIVEGPGTNNSSVKLAMMNKTFQCSGLWVEALFLLFTDLMECEDVNEAYNEILKFYELSNYINQHCIAHISQLFSTVVKFKMELYSPDAKLDEEKLSTLTTYLRAYKDKKFTSDQDRIIWYWLDTILIHKKSLEVIFNKNLMDCDTSQIVLATIVCRFLSAISDSKIPLVTDKRTDFMMIALVSWMQSIHKTCNNPLYEENQEYNLPICIFISAVCELFKSITKLASNTNYSNELFIEWNNIFAAETHTIILYSWKILSESKNCQNIEQFLLLSALSEVVIGHVDFIHFVIKSDLNFWIGGCADLLQSYCLPVRLAGFYIFAELASEMVKQDSCSSVVEDMDKKLTVEILPISALQSIINNVLSKYKNKGDQVFKSDCSAYVYVHSYLLIWMVVAKMCQKAPAQVKYRYASWLREEGYLEIFLNNLLILMPEKVHKNNISDGSVKKIRELFSSEPKFTLEEEWDSSKLTLLACRLYYLYLWLLPVFVRQWWKSLEYKDSIVVDKLTTKLVSPTLIMEEMKAVKMEKPIDNFSIKGYPTMKQIVATYSVEDSTMEITMQLATNHPLNIVKVDSSKAVLISNKWRTWSKQLNMYLAHQNSVIRDGLLSWKSNIDKTFEGVEECYICFSIVHSSNYQLPKQSCKTCHKKFHPLCLYRWFITSNKSSCPICRNYF